MEVERFLVHNVGRASVCRQWPLLPVSVQRHIKEAAPVALFQQRPRLGSLGSKVSDKLQANIIQEISNFLM